MNSLNYEEFDEESQALLQNTNWLNLEQVDKGLIAKNPFAGIISNKSFNEISNEYAKQSPFGKNSLFYTPEFIDENINFALIADYLKTKKDFYYDYEKFIGHSTFVLPLGQYNVIPIAYDTEIPFVQNTYSGDKPLQLKGKLYTEKGIVNAHQDNENDEIGGLEFEFDYRRRKVIYKINYYFVGQKMVYEKNNKGEIAFTVSSSNYEDFTAFLNINSRKISKAFEKEIKDTFLKAIIEVNNSIAQKKGLQLDGIDARNLDWLYQNIPSFVAKNLDFKETILNVFKLHFSDIVSPISDFTKPITAIIQKLNSENVYNYFYKNPKALIALLKGFDDDNLVKQFCNYLTAITFLYTKQDIEQARNFGLSDNTHIETNILYGDEKGKVELRNELQLPTIGFNGLNLINLFAEDIEINNPKKQNNQFHPLDIIYISQYDESNKEIEKYPSIALYGKFLGDKSEWSDVTDAALAVIDIAGIIVSAGALSAGIKGIARLYAIIDISISTINLALLSPDIRNKLNRTEAGRWFVNHWGMISFCVSAGTISYYLAKGVLKYGKNVKQQVSSNEQLAKQIDQLEEESRKILDQISDIKVAGPGGKGFLGGQRLNREQIRTWINFINKVSNGKASLKIVEKGDELYEQLIKEGAQAGFNPQTAQIVIKSGFTEFEIFHEVKHLEEYLKIGETDYIKGMARYGGSFEENLIRQYKRELYVYNRVMENSFKFNKAELKKSKNIISIIENSLKRNKIDYSQIKVD